VAQGLRRDDWYPIDYTRNARNLGGQFQSKLFGSYVLGLSLQDERPVIVKTDP